MRDVLSHERLIGRDDSRKFDNLTEEETMKLKYMSMIGAGGGGIGGDSTLNIKSFMKSLNSLSGGDDSIFAIIDDRFDVWL